MNQDMTGQGKGGVKPGFAAVRDAIRRADDLSQQGATMLLALASFANRHGVAYPGRDVLADLLKVSTRTITRWTKELRDKGYVVTSERRLAGRWPMTIHTLTPKAGAPCATAVVACHAPEASGNAAGDHQRQDRATQSATPAATAIAHKELEEEIEELEEEASPPSRFRGAQAPSPISEGEWRQIQDAFRQRYGREIQPYESPSGPTLHGNAEASS
jgi:hypothetical protein